MGAKVKLEFIPEGFAAILTSPEVAELIASRGEAIAAAAGEGMESSTFRANWGGSPRTVGIVVTATAEAKRAEAVDKALTSALGAGR